MNRQMVEKLLRWNIPNPYLLTMIGCTKLPSRSIPILRKKRPSHSSYNFLMRLKIGLQAFWLAWDLKRNPSKYIHPIEKINMLNDIKWFGKYD